MALRAGRKFRKSKNQITLEQLHLACRHVDELLKAGVTQNLAIRTLEIFVDLYAKVFMGGTASVHHVSQVAESRWSLAARKAKAKSKSARIGDYLRVEHAMPRRAFALKILDLYHKHRLTQRRLDFLVKKLWILTVITVEEDQKLNTIGRSKVFASAAEKYRAAGISFSAAFR